MRSPSPRSSTGLPFAGIGEVIEGALEAIEPQPLGHFEQLFDCDAAPPAERPRSSSGRSEGPRVSWLLAFAGFAALIILHEAGHMVAAKAVGMRVERFFLFFPPKIWSVRRGETEYGIGAIPLGGFVKITGMNPDEELPPDVAPRGYYHQPVWKRIVVIAAGPAVNLLIAFVILFFLAFDVAEPTNTVESVRPDSPAASILKPATSSSPWTGGVASSPSFATRSQPMRPRRADAGCRAETPAELTVIRDGREVTVARAPRRRRGGPAAARVRAGRSRSTRALSAPRSGRPTGCGT